MNHKNFLHCHSDKMLEYYHRHFIKISKWHSFPQDFFCSFTCLFSEEKYFFFRENRTKFKVFHNARKEERRKIKNVRLEIRAHMKYVSVMPWFFFSISHIMIIMVFFAIHCTNERIKLQEKKSIFKKKKNMKHSEMDRRNVSE